MKKRGYFCKATSVSDPSIWADVWTERGRRDLAC